MTSTWRSRHFFLGIPAPWNFLRSSEYLWVLHYMPQQTNTRTMPEPSVPGGYLITICNRLHITDAFYNRISFSEPLEYTAQPGPSRDKIFSVVLSHRHCKDNELLVEVVRQFGYLHPENGTLIPISGDHMKNAAHHSLKRMNVLRVPARHFRYTVRVAHSDTDYFRHLNNSHYLRFCMDAAAEAVKSGAFNNFTGDLFEYRLKDADLLYQAECHGGDELDIFVWEDDTKPNRLVFQIRKKACDVLFSNVTFYNKVKSNL